MLPFEVISVSSEHCEDYGRSIDFLSSQEICLIVPVLLTRALLFKSRLT